MENSNNCFAPKPLFLMKPFKLELSHILFQIEEGSVSPVSFPGQSSEVCSGADAGILACF